MTQVHHFDLRSRLTGMPMGRAEVPSDATRDSFYIIAPHKCGSVMLDHMIQGVCDHYGLPSFRLPNWLFARGFAFEEYGGEPELLAIKGCVFRGFRKGPDFFNTPVFAASRKIVLVRDPRDALVSYYFSVRDSHPIPNRGLVREKLLSLRDAAGALGIDSFVLSEAALAVADHIAWASTLSPHVFRYEDVVFEKARLVDELQRILVGTVDQNLSQRVAAPLDVFPDKERPTEHVRQVRPGNHKKHLKPETIAQLDTRYGDTMRRLGYLDA